MGLAVAGIGHARQRMKHPHFIEREQRQSADSRQHALSVWNIRHELVRPFCSHITLRRFARSHEAARYMFPTVGTHCVWSRRSTSSGRNGGGWQGPTPPATQTSSAPREGGGGVMPNGTHPAMPAACEMDSAVAAGGSMPIGYSTGGARSGEMS